jgi:hypothetical protein
MSYRLLQQLKHLRESRHLSCVDVEERCARLAESRGHEWSVTQAELESIEEGLCAPSPHQFLSLIVVYQIPLEEMLAMLGMGAEDRAADVYLAHGISQDALQN